MALITIAFNSVTMLIVHTILALLAGIVSEFHYNLPIFVLGFWAWNHDSREIPLKLFSFLLLFSIIIDITVMALNHGAHGGRYIFALVMNIISLVLKPVSIFFSLKEAGISLKYETIPENSNSNSDQGQGNQNPDAYQNS